MASQETYQPAFVNAPATHLAGIPTQNLKLQTPYISFGLPFTQAAAKHVKETFNCSRVYIVASGSLARQTSKVDELVAAIGISNVVGIRKGITPHTPWSEILEITAAAREARADCIVTLGAGSITDGSKIVCLALSNDISTREQLARYSVESTNPPGSVKEPTVPLIAIPTSLSGGEYFSLAGGTDDSTHHKQGFLHSGMGTRLIILDPELCLLTPPYHWLSTGVRSVDHCVEALCAFDSTPDSDSKAEQGLRKLVPNLLTSKKDPAHVEARHNCQMAVRLAMDNIRAGIPMGGSHAIGHQLGPLGVPHGITSCIMCPVVMKYNLKHSDDERVRTKQKKVCDILWSEDIVAKELSAAGLSRDISDLGDLLRAVITALGLPGTLKELGIKKDILPALSERALHDFWAPTNPIPLISTEQVSEILHSAFE